jgi:hypothetical protein
MILVFGVRVCCSLIWLISNMQSIHVFFLYYHSEEIYKGCFELIIAYAEGTNVFFKILALTCSKTRCIDLSRNKLTLF